MMLCMSDLVFKGVMVGDKLVGRGVPPASASALARWLGNLIADAHFVQIKLSAQAMSVWAESERGTEQFNYTFAGNSEAFAPLGKLQHLGLIVGHTYVFSKAAAPLQNPAHTLH